MSERRFVQMTLLLTLFGTLLRVWDIAGQPASPDDFGAAITAINFVENGQPGPTMWNHPALRNILMYFSMSLFGTGVVGIKIWGILFGSLCVPLMALVTRRLTGSAAVALLASFLWSLDPLAIDYSRQSINDVYLAFFPLAALYCGLRFEDRGSALWLTASGFFFGCGLASKWSALFQIVCLFFYLYRARQEEAVSGGLARKLFIASALGVLPVAVYLVTFFPWFGRGYGVDEWPAFQKAMYQETKLHQGYHKTITGDHRAYEWFIVPVTYVESFFVKTNEDGPRQEPTVDENVVILLAAANPLVWLLVLPSAGMVAYRGIKRRDRGLCLLAGLFFLSYLPLALTHRPIWVNTALVVLPYALMAVAWLLWEILGATPRRRKILTAYVVVVALIALPQYMAVTGKGFDVPHLREYLIDRYYPVDHG